MDSEKNFKETLKILRKLLSVDNRIETVNYWVWSEITLKFAMEKRILLEKRGREANQVRKAFRHSYILPIILIYRYASLSNASAFF